MPQRTWTAPAFWEVAPGSRETERAIDSRLISPLR